MHLSNGHLLQNGKYKLSNTIGQGGFGITYKGMWHTEVKGSLGKVKTDVPVCIKEYFFKDYCSRNTKTNAVEIHSETGTILFHKFKEKLLKEASILSAVHHPYIVNVLEVFEENNTAYIAMEYIAGASLRQRMEKEGILSENSMLKYIHQVGEALQFVHEKNILHLDIKPSNILIDSQDNARLIDFGVSKRYDMDSSQDTSTTMLTLSKGFASIEQYDDEGTLLFSPHPDIYSLGATMYNLLTGKIPTESILRATKELEKPTAFNPEITSKTESVIVKAMQVIPTDRYASVTDMLNALDLPPREVRKKNNIQLSVPSSLPEEDSETVLYDPGSLEETKEAAVSKLTSKKRKKSIGFAFILVLLLLVSSVFLFFNNKNTPVIVAAVSEKPLENKEKPVPEENTNKEVKHEEDGEVDVIAPPENHVAEKTDVIHTAEKIEEEKEEDKPVQVTDVPEVEISDLSQVMESTLVYEELLASGEIKMESGDFTGAKSDFEKAREQKLTEEVVRFIIAADAKIEEQSIVEKKRQYEEKMAFGSNMIARKKETDRYGVIDTNGNEIIACIYLSVGRAENGRAFLREDNLFDIYNENGQCLSEGVANY